MKSQPDDQKTNKMNINETEIANVIKELSLDACYYERKGLLEQVFRKFCINDSYDYPLWESLKGEESLKSSRGWQLCGNYLPEEPKLLFCEPNNSNLIFEFKNSHDMTNMLANSFGFVFYV